MEGGKKGSASDLALAGGGPSVFPLETPDLQTRLHLHVTATMDANHIKYLNGRVKIVVTLVAIRGHSECTDSMGKPVCFLPFEPVT